MKAMRDAFLERLYEIARGDRNVVFVSNDFGAPALDRFRLELPQQFVHIGIAEANLINVGAGLAMAGKNVYVYSISPFVPMRCFEQMKMHMGFRKLQINAVVVGAGFSYDKSGPTHHSLEDVATVGSIPGVELWTPSDSALASALADHSCRPGPKYIRFDREKLPALYPAAPDLAPGFALHGTPADLLIVSTGTMVHEALRIAESLRPLEAGVLDLFRVKPLNVAGLLEVLKSSKRIATLEEHYIHGGIGSVLSGLLDDQGLALPMKRFGAQDQYYFEYGGREALRKLAGLDVESVTARIRSWVGAAGGKIPR